MIIFPQTPYDITPVFRSILSRLWDLTFLFRRSVSYSSVDPHSNGLKTLDAILSSGL